MSDRVYYVSFNERAVITEVVTARSKAEAIRLVKAGDGERVGFEIDETRWPTSFEAIPEPEQIGTDDA